MSYHKCSEWVTAFMTAPTFPNCAFAATGHKHALNGQHLHGHWATRGCTTCTVDAATLPFGDQLPTALMLETTAVQPMS
jgi:hypothetical protein